jgi:hypothetical protein
VGRVDWRARQENGPARRGFLYHFWIQQKNAICDLSDLPPDTPGVHGDYDIEVPPASPHRLPPGTDVYDLEDERRLKPKK